MGRYTELHIYGCGCSLSLLNPEDTKPEESQGLDDRWMFYQQDGEAMQDPVQSLFSNNKVVASSHSLFVCVFVTDRQNFESPKAREQLFLCKTTSIPFTPCKTGMYI